MPTYNVTYTPTTGGSLSATGTGTATTLGLLYTDAHLAEWQDRALYGPYKSANDSFDPLIPGEWDRIVINKNAFVANPQLDQRQTWEDIQDNGFAINNHKTMLDAAFYSLVEEDSALATVVKDELMWEATRAGEDGVGMQISPTRYLTTDSGNWWNAGYMTRIVMIADFVKDSFSTAERTTFNAWISDWAYALEFSIDNELDAIWPIATTEITPTPRPAIQLPLMVVMHIKIHLVFCIILFTILQSTTIIDGQLRFSFLD
jgi:hypothetical protein